LANTVTADPLEEYNREVQLVMLDFQFIEESLRCYLSTVYKVARKRLNGDIPFKLDARDLLKDALGTLVSRFERHTNDDELVKELRDLIKHRNETAHRAFLLRAEETADSEFLRRQTDSLAQVKARTGPCVMKILERWEEIQRFEGKDA
jgi:hypothetical protein